jgi:hypothetical protein
MGRAFSALGLLALLAFPPGGTGAGAPIYHPVVGFGQLEKALPAELRKGRPAVVRSEKIPGGDGFVPNPVSADPPEDRPFRRMAGMEPGRGVAIGVSFLRPVSQAPPIPI